MNNAEIEPETFHQLEDFLEEYIDPDSGLLDKLQSSNALTAKEIRLIKHQATFDQRNKQLLEYVTKQNKYNLLIHALKETQQEHIVNYLIGKGEYCPDFGDEWPELSIVYKNQEVLIKIISPEELVGLLYQKALISKRQLDVINSKPTSHEKNESLLEILRRRSLKDFKVTIECLRESNQSHVANVLEHEGEYCPDFGDEWPMSDAELSIVNKNQEVLLKIISPDELVGHLYMKRVINERQRDAINSKPTCHERNESLLEILRRRSLRDFKVIIEYLRKSNKGHVANVLEHGGEYCPNYGDEWPLRESELSILKTNQEALIEIISPDELVGLMYSRSVITKRQRDAIMSKPTCHEKNESLLEILRRGSIKDYKVTIECLRETNQKHVAEVLEKGGVVVRIHAQGLDDTIEDELIDIFTNVLRNVGLPIEKSEHILQRTLIELTKGQSIVLYIYCRTLEELMQLKEAQANGELKKSVQRLFTKLRYHTQKTKVTVQNLTKIFKSTFTRLFNRSKFDEISVTLPMKEYDRVGSYFPEYIKIRAVYDFNPIDMSSKQRDELQKVIQLNNDNFKNPQNEFDKMEASESENSGNSWKRRLNIYEETLPFKKGDVMEAIPPINIGDTITWWKAMHLESGEIGYVPRSYVVIDYQMHLDQEYATSASIGHTEYLKSATSKISTNNLPLEFLDSILQKVYLKQVLREKQVLMNKDYEVISQLASVDCFWFQRIRRKKFKKELWRSLVEFYRRKEKISSHYRINRQYLEENIRLKGLVKRLKSNDFLTDVQAASLYRQNLQWSSFERFMVLTSEIMIRMEAIHSVFRGCLCDNKQQPIAEVIENGRVMVKVEIKFQKATTSVKTRLRNLEIVEQINEIQDNTKARSHQIEELMSKLKQDNMEILVAGQDGEIIVVWIWCKTKCALEKLQTMNKSKPIMDVFTELVTNLLSLSSEERNAAMDRPKVNIDFEQFQKTVDAAEDKREANGLNQSADGIPEDTTREKGFGAKTERPTEENFPWDEAMRRHRKFLLDQISADVDLLDNLRTSDTISYKEMQKIDESGASYKRNRKLLNIIIKRNKQNELIEALETSGQSHLVNYLKTDGKNYEAFHGDLPLKDHEVKILHKIIYEIKKLQTLNKSKNIFDIFTELVKNLSFSSEDQKLAMMKPKVKGDIVEQSQKTTVETEANTEAIEDKNEASGLSQAVKDKAEETIHESFGAKTKKPTEENFSWDDAMRRHYDFLVERMFTEFDLLNKLRMTQSVSDNDIQKINESGKFSKRNRKLLDIIIKKNKQHELIEALRTSGQIHLVNYLKTDGNYDAIFGEEWPLTQKEILLLDRNLQNLIDHIEISDLLRRLYSTGVIGMRQRDFINSKPTPYEKNEALLDTLRRSSLSAYRQTIRCLHASNQSHIAEILESGGVLLRIDTKVQGDAIAVNQAEEEIVAGITNLLGNRSLAESSRIWELIQLNLMAARQGH